MSNLDSDIEEVVEKSIERILVNVGPCTDREITKAGYQSNWLIIGGMNGETVHVPLRLVRDVLEASPRFTQDGGGRWQLSS